MVYSRIVIRGTVDKEPKVNKDGSADIILTNTYEETANKDIRDKGDSIFLVKLRKRLYEKHKKQFNRQREISIIGYVKTGLSKKGAPFVYVSPTSIEFTKLSKINIKKNKIFKTKTQPIPWWQLLKDEDFIEISSSEIDIIDDRHLNGCVSELNIKRRNTSLCVAVKPYNGRYELIIGLKPLMIAKVFNLNVKAYVTDESYDELVERFDIDGENINNINSNEEHEDKERLS